MEGGCYFRSEDEFDVIDVYDLFAFYNRCFFEGVLASTTVEWSDKMTLCAGSCSNPYPGSCVIKLSGPLLKFRSANQVKETLLHEMIHAFLFLTNPRACQTEGGHGKEFKEMMGRINEETGLKVTIYHSFHDEVDLYRKHIWRCDGQCRNKPPFFGYVKRAMNRKPQPADRWFKQHQRTCGGTFVKISLPDDVGKKQKNSVGKNKRNWGSGKPLEEYFKEMGEGKQVKKQSRVSKNMDDYLKEMREKSAMTGKGKTIAEYCSQIQHEKSLSQQNTRQK